MATLFNTKISQTYEGLLKTIDNAVISATLRELTDGSGNQSGLYLNTAGDFKVTNVLEWGSLKDTGTGVTITRYVTSTDGIENFDNNTSLPTSAAVKLYVDTKFSQTDTLTEVLGFGNTTSGKDIVVSAGDDITFTDSSKAIFGTGSDLQIYHDGNNAYIKQATVNNSLILSSTTIVLRSDAGENFMYGTGNAEVALFYDGSEKFRTLTDGAKVTGNLLVTGTITGAGGSFLPLAGGTMTGNIVLNDNVKSIYGTASDGLEIYHDGSSSYIKDSGTGNFNVQSNSSIFFERTTGENMAAFRASNVELYYSGSSKFETTSTGVSVIGALSTTTNVTVGANATFVDNGKALFGNSNELEIYHDSTNNIIKSSSGQLKLLSNAILLRNSADDETLLSAFANDTVILYNNNIEKFRTLGAGAKVTGNLEVTGTITGAGGSFLPLIGGTMTGDTIHNDNVRSIYGTASDGLEIYHTGTDSLISDSGTGDLKVLTSLFRLQSNGGESMITAFANGATWLYYDNSRKLETTSTGISVTGNGAFSGNVSVPDTKFLIAGSSGDVIIGHDGSNSTFRNSTGDLNIEQFAITQSIIFKVSNSTAGDTTALTINRYGDLLTGRDVTIAGDLTVNGTTTTVNSQTLSVVDPLIQLAKDNTANSLDIGLYGDYNDGTDRFLGLFSDASDGNKFKLFKGLTVEPTTTVNLAGAGYVAADLQVAGLEATTGVFTGALSSVGFTSSNINTNQLTTATANGNIIVRNNAGSTITTFNNDRSVTFAGNITVGDSHFIGDDSDDNLLIQSSANENVIIDSSDDLFFRTSGTTQLQITSTTSTFAGYVTVNSSNITGVSLTVGGESGNGIKTQYIFSGSGQRNWQIGMSTHLSQTLSITPSSANGNTTFTTPSFNLNGETNAATFAGNVILNNSDIDFKYSDGVQYYRVGLGASANFEIYNTNYGRTDLLITQSTGNATFAGAVTTNGYLYVQGQATPQIFMNSNTAGTPSWTFIARNDGYFLLGRSGVSNDFYFDPSGNATFSGSVTANTNSTPTLIVGRDGTDGDVVQVYNGATGSTKALAISVSGNDGNIYSQYGDVILQASAGKVGIGTDSPSSMLSLRNPTAGASTLSLQHSTTSSEFQFINGIAGITGDSLKIIDVTSSYNYMTFRLGNVGIGTDNPSNNFVVAEGTDQHGIELVPGTTSYIQAYDRATSDYGDLKIDAQTIAFGTDNGTERMRIDSSGNSTFTGSVRVSNPTQSNYWLYNASKNNGFLLGRSLASNDGQDFFIFDTIANTSRLTIDSSGNSNFGGGVTALALTVNGGNISASFNGSGSSYTQGAIAINSSNTDTPEARGQGIFYHNQGKDTTWYTGTRYNNADIWQIGRATGVSLNTESSRPENAFLTVENTGNVLIGTGVQIGVAANKVIINSQASFQSSTLESHIINANGTGAYGSGDLLIQPRCSTVSPNKIVFFTSNQTNTPVERMSVKHNGEVKINGDAIISDFKYSGYATAGLDTTGVVVATISGAGNGASSTIEFVGMGGVNGIVDVVYNCTNQGGNWYAYKNERQTPGGIDVVATGDGTTTITFTFKAVSATQGYTPRVRMIGSPSATVFFPN